MKGNFKDLVEFIDEIKRAISGHPDTMRDNPDLAIEARRLRDRADRRYRGLSDVPPPKPEGWAA